MEIFGNIIHKYLEVHLDYWKLVSCLKKHALDLRMMLKGNMGLFKSIKILIVTTFLEISWAYSIKIGYYILSRQSDIQ